MIPSLNKLIVKLQYYILIYSSGHKKVLVPFTFQVANQFLLEKCLLCVYISLTLAIYLRNMNCVQLPFNKHMNITDLAFKHL